MDERIPEEDKRRVRYPMQRPNLLITYDKFVILTKSVILLSAKKFVFQTNKIGAAPIWRSESNNMQVLPSGQRQLAFNQSGILRGFESHCLHQFMTSLECVKIDCKWVSLIKKAE